MTPEQTAALSRQSVRYLGSAYAQCPKTLRVARELGLTGWAFFVVGIGGVLGDVDADVVAAAIGFIAVEAVRDAWTSARQARPVSEIAARSLAECCRWGAEKLDRFPGVTRLADLTEQAARSVGETAMPLLAAWRSVSATVLRSFEGQRSAGARAAVQMNLLRHHRAASHLIAVRATGLAPVEAILAGDDGEAGAVAFGWQPPFPPCGPLTRKRAWAEALTDRIAGEAFAGLSTAERREFVALADAAREFAQSPAVERPAVPPHQRPVVDEVAVGAPREPAVEDEPAAKESRTASVARVDP